jgi:subtilisin family serine protease
MAKILNLRVRPIGQLAELSLVGVFLFAMGAPAFSQTLPETPFAPDPPHLATDVPITRVLSWNDASGQQPVAAGSGSLYGGDDNNEFGVLDRPSGLFNLIGSSASITGMAFDPNSGTLYATTGNEFGTIDRLTGAFSPVGPTAVSLEGLAFDPNRDILYAFDQNSDQLYTVDPLTGLATPVGLPNGSSSIGGLAFDASTDTLYGVDDANVSILVTIDTQSGAFTPLGGLWAGVDDVDGLAYCPDDGMLYAVNDGNMLRIDPATRRVTAIEPTGKTWGSVFGLACSDRAVDIERYDVYLDTANPPLTKVSAGQPETSYDPGGLEELTTYYWQVVSSNFSGEATGPVWQFSTEDVLVPDIVVTPGSLSVTGQVGQATTQTLTVANNPTADANLEATLSTRETGRSLLSAAAAGVGNPDANRDFNVVQAGVRHTPKRLLVRFSGDVKPQARAASVAARGGTITTVCRIVPGLVVVELPAGQNVADALAGYNAAAGVIYAEPDYHWKAIVTTPNDARFDELWGMHNTGQTGGTPDADINAPEAWDITRGRETPIVAVIDTGVDYLHEDLADNMWVNTGEIPGNGVDDDGNGFMDDVYGYDFFNGDGDPMDDDDHGTHVAGTIGAVGNNNLGVAGVSWDVRIMALKFISGFGGSTEDAISCIEYAVLMDADIMSNSWGGEGFSQALKDAIDAAGAAGIAFVAASGNSATDNDTVPHYPSNFESANIISVMSTDHNDLRSGFSTWGLTTVDLAAPGSDILSCKRGGGYVSFSGTSMATPHVSGACALMLSVNPTLSVSDIRNALMSTVDPVLPGLCVSGGRMNLVAALGEVGAPWLRVSPELIAGLPPGDSTVVDVVFDATGDAASSGESEAIEFSPGAYTGAVVVASNDPDEPEVIVPAVFTVLPDDLSVTPSGGLVSSGSERGPFAPSQIEYVLENIGAGPVTWSVSWTQAWVTVTPSNGVLLSPGMTQAVTLAINANANSLSSAEYAGSVGFLNVESGTTAHRDVELTVTAAPGEIYVTDSISPLDDLDMDFGEVGLGQARTEQITIDNLDSLDSLVVSGVSLDGSVATLSTDHFTELFNSADLDLQNQTLRFVPDGSANFYRVCREDASGFPTDPSGGTVLPVELDDFVEVVPIGPQTVQLYGTVYTRFFVGSNGCITFEAGDIDFSESLFDHFRIPRISALFHDLDPSLAGSVSWRQLSDRVAVTYENVPRFAGSDQNSFQVELFIDGKIQITHLGIAVSDGLVGLSQGLGEPAGFVESDLNAYGSCSGFFLSQVPSLPYSIPPLDSLSIDVTFLPEEESASSGTVSILTNDEDDPTVEVSLHALGVVDDLAVNPEAVYESSGFIGGTFSPTSRDYWLFNNGSEALTWSATHQSDWLIVSTTSGVIGARSSRLVRLIMSSQAALLPPGVHTDTVTFHNNGSGATLAREVELTVRALPGEIEVTDSIEPIDDLEMDFGEVRIGEERIEQFAINNQDPLHDLVISGLNLGGSVIALSTDYFTEQFDASAMDLQNQTLKFVPDGSANYYRVCREQTSAFPTDPSGGAVLLLNDDDFEHVTVNNSKSVRLYGETYTGFFVGSNGYITFDIGDTDFSESLPEHFGMRRISALFDDLNPSSGGKVSWRQLTDRIAVTYENVSQFGSSDQSSFQVEMFFDGEIHLTHLGIDISDGLVGLSAGLGVPPDFVESDLSEYGKCSGFILEGVPTLPHAIPPLGSLPIDVRFMSQEASTSSDTAMILSNDENEPMVTVALLGQGVADELLVTPSTGLESAGFERGPFTESQKQYVLENTGTGSVTWSATWTQNWVTVTPPGGLLLSQGATEFATIEINANAELLAPGVHSDFVSFQNVGSGATQLRDVILTVSVAPGEIEVTDSILPIDDLDMDFGAVRISESRTEQITISNKDPIDDLVISGVRLDGSLTGLATDYFTERFDFSGADLQNQTLRFVPDGSANFYRACLESASAFPTDPAGGTELMLGDDDFEEVYLSEGTFVLLYGSAYSRLFVGSNGYITFTAGDSDFDASLSNHFRLPRISGLFDDLFPVFEGSVRWEELDDRVAVTFEEVPGFGFFSANSFQIEMFFNGEIRLTYLGINTIGGMVGLSEGLGVPDGFVESDLSAYGSCSGFRLSGLPSIPYAVPPLASLAVDVIFEPLDASASAENVTIFSNDEDQPTVEVSLHGEGVPIETRVEIVGNDLVITDVVDSGKDDTLEILHGLSGPLFVEDTNHVLASSSVPIIGLHQALIKRQLAFDKILVELRGGDDSVEVNQLYGRLYAPVEVDSGSGSDSIRVTGTFGNDTLFVADGLVTGNIDSVSWSNTEDVTVSSDLGSDIFWSLSGKKTFEGGAGDDVYIFTPNWGMDWIVEDPDGGFDTMDFSLIPDPMDVSVASIVVTEDANSAMHADQEIESLITGSAGDTVAIKGYQNALNIQTLGGSDTVTIGDNNSLDNVTGAIDLDGGTGFNRLSVSDGDDVDTNLYTFSPGSFQRSGSAPVTYINFKTFEALLNNDVLAGTVGDGAGGVFWALIEGSGTSSVAGDLMIQSDGRLDVGNNGFLAGSGSITNRGLIFSGTSVLAIEPTISIEGGGSILGLTNPRLALDGDFSNLSGNPTFELRRGEVVFSSGKTHVLTANSIDMGPVLPALVDGNRVIGTLVAEGNVEIKGTVYAVSIEGPGNITVHDGASLYYLSTANWTGRQSLMGGAVCERVQAFFTSFDTGAGLLLGEFDAAPDLTFEIFGADDPLAGSWQWVTGFVGSATSEWFMDESPGAGSSRVYLLKVSP